MAKFMLLYKGPATPPEAMDAQKRNAILGAWKVWMDGVGGALADVGAPMANGHAVMDDGSSGQATELTGYSILEAENMDAAVKMVDGHPFLSDKTGKFSVEVFELMPVPM